MSPSRPAGSWLRRLRHVAGVVVRVLGSVLGTAILVVIVSLDLPAVRRWAVSKVNEALVSTFAGKITIESIGHLGLTGLGGARVRVTDPEGVQVAFIDGLRVGVSTWAAARSYLFGKGDLEIEVGEIGIDAVDVDLDVDTSGTLRLVRAIMPKSAPTTGAARGTVVRIRQIGVQHVWAHGAPDGSIVVDADIDQFAGSIISTPRDLTVDVKNLLLQTRNAPSHVDPHLRIEAHYEKPTDAEKKQSITAKIKGDIGGIPTTLAASMVGEEVSATLDVPPFATDKLQAIVAGAPAKEDASLHVDVHGRLPDVDVISHATLGAGAVDARVHTSLDKTTLLHAVIDVAHIDARAFSPAAPVSALDATLVVDAEQSDAATKGTYTLDLRRGSLAHNVIPAAHVSGNIAAPGKTSRDGQATTMTGRGNVDEPGAPVDLSFTVRSAGAATTIHFDAASSVSHLEKTRLGKIATGAVVLHAVGAAEFARASSIDARVELTGSQLAEANNRIKNLALYAHAKGALGAPFVEARVAASSLSLAGAQFANLLVTVKGDTHAVDVTALANPIDGPKIDASAKIELGGVTRVSEMRLIASRNDVCAALGVKSIQEGPDQLHVEGLELAGLGDTLRAEVHHSHHAWSVRASTNELDMAKLSRLLRNRDLDGGRAAFDIDLDVTRTKAKGHARFDISQITIERVRDANAHVDLNVEGRQLDAVIHAALGQTGVVDLRTTKLAVGDGDLLRASTWKDALGQVDVNGTVDIAKVRALLPKAQMPFDEMDGHVQIVGEVRRESAESAPEATLAIQTAGLVLSGRSDHDKVDNVRLFDTPPWRLSGVDFAVNLGVRSTHGATELTIRAFDKQSDLGTLELRGDTLPYAEWLHGKPPTVPSLLGLPIQMALVVPARDLKTLPAVLRTRGWSGTAGGRLDVDGTLLNPSAHLAVVAKQLSSFSMGGATPLDGTLDARYGRGQSKLTVSVDSNGARLLDADVEAAGEFPRLFVSPEQPVPWRGSSKIHLVRFPLGTLTKLTESKMKGDVSGDVTIDDLHQDPRLHGDLTFDRLAVGKVAYPRARASIGFDGQLLKGSLHLEQVDGSLDANAELGMIWKTELAPSVDRNQRALFAVQARRFRAEALLPFASGALSDLSGRMDGGARIEMTGASAKMQGVLTLQDGKFQLTTVGEPFSGVHAKVTMTPDGMIRLDDVVAHGSTGTVNMNGYARLNGLAFSDAKASIHIPKSDALPVEADGQAIGDIDGDVNFTAVASAGKKQLDLRIDIPILHTLLPGNESHAVQELKEAKEIHVGYHRRSNVFVKVPEVADDFKPAEAEDTEPTVTKVAINLGKDVEVKKGTSLRVALDGNPVLVISDKARMTGQLRLKRGFLDVQGHRFDIEKGTVTFLGDEPGNPQVLVTAVWKAPEGSLVYADFTGPLKTGKVTLRSEPSHTQNEIISLIIFGSTDGQASASYQSQDQAGVGTTGKAGAAAGGLASEGLSKGLADLTGLDVAAKVDTSTANPRPEVVLQISRTISLQLGYVIGTLPLTNPDRTLVTVGWRFIRNWELDGTYGNAGTTLLDWIWQYRY